MTTESPPATIAALLLARACDDNVGLVAGDRSWTWTEVVAESATRAAVLQERRRPGPFHVGVLLDNVPEYLFWLGAAALSGAAIVGINPTRRGQELQRDVAHTDCQLVVTDRTGLDALDGVVLPDVLVTDQPGYAAAIAEQRGAPVAAAAEADPSSLFLLIFTSGSTGAPKAVRCTQGRLAAIAARTAVGYRVVADDVCLALMPLFHANSIMAVISPALAAGATIALPSAGKFSASGFLPDVRRYGATYFNYVGKALGYILATEASPDDVANTLQRGFGSEAPPRDRERFEARFGCPLIEGYGGSEGGATIAPVAGMPPTALGRGATADIVVLDAHTGQECPRALFDSGGRLTNADEAIGEIVNKGATGFEGYYANPTADAERTRQGWYWTGDLAYRDDDGWFYFAGRNSEWLRVDGENFAAAPVERILQRFEPVANAVVYAVPDPQGSDSVMCALELHPGSEFDPQAFAEFLGAQADLGTKWAPRFVRIVDQIPATGSSKVLKAPLQRHRWEAAGVWWSPDRGPLAYRRVTAADIADLAERFAAAGRPLQPISPAPTHEGTSR